MATRDEFAEIVLIMQAGSGLNLDANSVEVWFRSLADHSAENLRLAVFDFLRTSKWKPTIAEINSRATEYRDGLGSDWGSAFEIVMRAVRWFGLDGRDRAERALGPDLWRVVESLGWESICDSRVDNRSTLRAQFRQIYGHATERDSRITSLPADVSSRLVGDVAQRLGVDR